MLNPTKQDRCSRRAPSAKAYIVASIIMFLATLGLAAITNYVVNPYGWYAPKLVWSRTVLSRATKVSQLRQAIEPPSGLILGSSRVMQLEPSYLQAKTGYPFYNAGVNAAKVEDYLAMLRFYLNTFRRPPRMIVLGIDVLAFNLRPTNAMLLKVPELSRTIADLISPLDPFFNLANLINWNQTVSSIHSLIVQFIQGIPEPIEPYLPDGTVHYLELEKQKANRSFDLRRILINSKPKLINRFAGFSHLSAIRQEAFILFLKLCRDHDIQLVTFLTPWHPDILPYLIEKMDYLERKQELESFLDSVQYIYKFPTFNFSDIQNFRGYSKDFKDEMHYLRLNSRRIIDEIDRRINLKDF